jgi:hypothetical protein
MPNVNSLQKPINETLTPQVTAVTEPMQRRLSAFRTKTGIVPNREAPACANRNEANHLAAIHSSDAAQIVIDF